MMRFNLITFKGVLGMRRFPRVVFALTLSALCGCTGVDGGAMLDSDGDGLTDEVERLLGTDLTNPDTDGDGLLDGEEIERGSSPLSADSDNDGIPDRQDSTLGPPSRASGSVSTGNDVEPNDTFATATLRNMLGLESIRLEGSIDRVSDVDVFNLGSLSAGDRVIVDFDPRGGRLQPVVALFDAAGELFATRKDNTISGGSILRALVDERIRHDSRRYYLAVALSMDRRATGLYRFDVTIERGNAAPPPQPQVVFFDFDGGALDNPLLGVTTVASFSATAISSAYAGDDELIRSTIVATFRENFSDFAVTLYTSDEVDRPPVDRFSTLLFGSFNASVFGVSEGVDLYNLDQCDDGIIFTESFASHVFGFLPRAEEVGVAIGNVAAHEVGHLLGLNHVTDVAAIMDASSPAVFLLDDQTFGTFPLAETVFPFGVQNDIVLLSETVGVLRR